MGGIKEKIFRAIIYFKRGHGAYSAFIVSLLNFVVIQYRLLIERIPILQALFPKLWVFIAFVVLVYVPIVTILGWWDVKRGLWQEEGKVLTGTNPTMRKILEKLEKIEKEIEEMKTK